MAALGDDFDADMADAGELAQASDLAPRDGGEDVDLAMHPSGIVPQLQNVVATVNLNCKLDLKQIALHARNAEYNPKRFAAVIMRIREPKTTALIFASGKMVCTGAKSESDSRLAARKYARIVQRLGFSAEFKEFKIQNIVGSCDVKFPIRLEGLSYSHGYFATYEPELFPGLIYRMKQPKIVLLIFVSGKVVLTGAKRREEIYQAFENIYPTLCEFKKATDAAAGLGALAAAAGVPALPAPTAGAAGGSGAAGAGTSGAVGAPAGSEQRQMPPPASMPPPPPMSAPSAAAAAATPGGAGGAMPPPARRPAAALPPPSPMHQPNLPPATPTHVPPATPAYVPPATPAYVPPTTPGFMPPPAASPLYHAPSLPLPASRAPAAGQAPKQQQ